MLVKIKSYEETETNCYEESIWRIDKAEKNKGIFWFLLFFNCFFFLILLTSWVCVAFRDLKGDY